MDNSMVGSNPCPTLESPACLSWRNLERCGCRCCQMCVCVCVCVCLP